MTYGVEVRNAAGAIVFNSANSVLMAKSKGTETLPLLHSFHTATAIQNEAMSSFYAVNQNKYGVTLPLPAYGQLYLFEVSGTGNRLHARRQSNGIEVYSSQSTLRWVLAESASNIIPASSGYGMEVYNAQGEITWSAAVPIISTLGTLQDTGVDGDWFAFNDARSYSGGVGQNVYLRGVRRTATGFTKEHWQALNETGHPQAYLLGSYIRGFVAEIDFLSLDV